MKNSTISIKTFLEKKQDLLGIYCKTANQIDYVCGYFDAVGKTSKDNKSYKAWLHSVRAYIKKVDGVVFYNDGSTYITAADFNYLKNKNLYTFNQINFEADLQKSQTKKQPEQER